MRTSYLLGVCAAVGLQAAVMAQGGWTQVASNGPPPRSGHAMAYDSLRHRTVLFGGEGSSNPFLGDTWEWDGSIWSLAASSGPQSRRQHAMAFDSLRGRVVLFGGTGSGVAFGDTWEWDGSSWSQVAATGPTSRWDHEMAFDSQRGKIVLTGGVVTGGTGYRNDTWEWNGSQWTEVVSATWGSIGNHRHCMAYDGARGRTVMTGGNLQNTWEFNGQTWALMGAGPGNGSLAAMVYDSLRGTTVLFGGSWSGVVSGTTQQWDGQSWAAVAAGGPAPRYNHAMAYESHRGCTVLFGGEQSGGLLLGDTWEWRGSPGLASTFGSGCGSPPIALLATGLAPMIGSTASASLTNIPASLAFVALGWSRTLVGPFGLPFPLAGYGMPGCQLLQSSEVTAPVQWASPSTATYSLLLPNWSGLIGLHLYLQGWAPAPGVNPGNTIVSNGLEWVVGY